MEFFFAVVGVIAVGVVIAYLGFAIPAVISFMRGCK